MDGWSISMAVDRLILWVLKIKVQKMKKKIVTFFKRVWRYMKFIEEQRIKAMIKSGRGWS